MFGKIVDGKLVVAGNKIQIKNGWITNPTEKQLKDNGYKEIVSTEKSKFDSTTEKLVENYKDNGKEIEINFAKVKKTDVEIAEALLDGVSKEDILNAIVGNKEATSKIEEVLKEISSIKVAEK